MRHRQGPGQNPDPTPPRKGLRGIQNPALNDHGIALSITFRDKALNGKTPLGFPAMAGTCKDECMSTIGSYLKKHTEALVKDVGIEPACQLTGKSKATLGRYYSDHDEHADRFMPIDAVAALEEAATYPHVTGALAELQGIGLNFNSERRNTERTGGVNSDVIALSQRFAMLMAEYQQSIEDGVITVNEAKRLLRETTQLQQVLIDMKLHLEEETG